MLEVINASKTFAKGTPNEHKALDHLNLSLKEGEFVTILGSNGAGKSTLFNAICGNFLLDEGSVILDGLVAQLVRAPPCHGGGHGFESRLGRS